METNTDPLLDQSGAAAILGKAERTLENWRSRRYGPRYVKVGGAVRYRESDLYNWLERRTVDPSKRAA